RGVPQPMPRFAEIDGQPTVALGVMVRSANRIDRWRESVQQELDAFQRELPSGISLKITLDQNEYVESRLSSLTFSLLLGATAVIFVVLCLMGWRSAMIVAVALPLSGFTVLFGLRVLEIPIHQMSITGMIIALGLLIDNAIVMVDEVVTEMREGRSPIDAVASTVRHLALPLAGSTVTTALAFAPIAMMPGPAGEFVGSIAVSVILAIFASLLFSLTVIPVLAAKFAHRAGRKESHSSDSGWLGKTFRDGLSSRRVGDGYRRLLFWIFRRPMRGIAISMALPVVGFVMFTQLPEQFFPPADRDQFHIELELPANASIDATRTAAQRIDELLRDSGAERITWFYGESAPAFYYNVLASRRGVANFASAVVRMNSTDGLRETLRSLQRQADTQVPNARVLVRQLEQGPPFTSPIEIQVFGPDLDQLQRLGDQVRVALASVPDVTHTKSLLGETLPSISLRVDEAAARLAGFQPTDISRQLFDQLEGSVGGQVLEDTEQIPVRVRVGDELRGDLAGIASLELIRGDRLVPLASVADVHILPEVAVIPRMNRRRMNRIEGYIAAGTLPSKSLAMFQQRLDDSGFELPPGYSLEYGGEASQRDQAVGNLMANVGVLGVLMIATMVLSFRSFRLASIIFAIALASVGLGMIGLWFGGFPFGFMAIIGTMGLIGVAINDSIVVLAALKEQRPQGPTAVNQTVDIVMRSTRHIVATTLTTIAGFAPLILGGGEFWPPLAIAIAGGVSGATLLALAFAPSAYLLLTRCNSCVPTQGTKHQLQEEDAAVPIVADSIEMPHAAAAVATG
ncbi:MAG: efflux RND transporter permease subunit, partial [Rubripirellula sp.]